LRHEASRLLLLLLMLLLRRESGGLGLLRLAILLLLAELAGTGPAAQKGVGIGIHERN
jgi:hypothetical protein